VVGRALQGVAGGGCVQLVCCKEKEIFLDFSVRKRKGRGGFCEMGLMEFRLRLLFLICLA
jgi:hypothetical protein